MEESLTRESEKLARSWQRHDRAWLRDYLVAGVEDPRLNLQSIFSRHFLARQLTGETFSALMREECRFSAVMNWLVLLAGRSAEAEELDTVLYALRRGADNAEGTEIPSFVAQTFAGLPVSLGSVQVPNYVESFLSGTTFGQGQAQPYEPSLRVFQELWRGVLAPFPAPAPRLSVLEPACGSANDYRFLHAYGLAPLLDYTGFDLCDANVENALALFPGVRFGVGNVFNIDAPAAAFDVCFVHDLFEHLSISGMETAVREICRVTRRGLCLGFFQMEELRDHVVRPVDEYHCNLLSMARMKSLFASLGYEGQVIHIATFLRGEFGCDYTHNPQAYTFLLERREEMASAGCPR